MKIGGTAERVAKAATRVALRSFSRPAVTIIIPVYNGEKYLQACLESVLSQSLRSMEVLCVDDGSTDGSLEILERARRDDRRIRILRNEMNLGVANSRNRAIGLARGRFTRFVDGDDLLPPDSVAVLHEAAIRNGADVAGGANVVFKTTDPSNVLRADDLPDRPVTRLSEEPDLWIPWWFQSYLISTDMLRAHRIRFPDLLQGEDPVFLARVLTTASRISLTSRHVYLYRKYPKTTGSGGRALPGFRDFLVHAELVKATFTAYDPKCWEKGYGPFTKNIVGTWILDAVQGLNADVRLSPDDLTRLREEIIRIWGSDIDPLTLRRESWWPRDWTRPSVRPRPYAWSP